MPIEAVVAALLSAVIHAAWNANLKSGADRLADLVVMGCGGMLLGLGLIIGRGLPDQAAWPFLLGSSAVHIVYWAALTRGYATGDLSHVYTVARGMAPLLVALAAAFWAHETPSVGAVLGILLVSVGIAAVGLSRSASARATGWAALTGTCIACYSLLDALGARASGDVAAYMGLSTFASFLPTTAFGLQRRGLASLQNAMRGRWTPLLAAGAVTNVGFGLALWAQTRAPIAHVTALRETSVVFGAAIAAVLLRERVSARRWLGAVLVAVGALALAVTKS